MKKYYGFPKHRARRAWMHLFDKEVFVDCTSLETINENVHEPKLWYSPAKGEVKVFSFDCTTAIAATY